MEFQQKHNIGVVWGSIVIALMLSIFPLPFHWSWFRPEFVALVMIYWVVTLPQHVGIGFAWCVGLIQDVVENALLGQHALALVPVAYVCLLSYQRIRSYALWQQSGWVFILVGLHQLFWNWIHSITGKDSQPLIFLVPALVSALIWPLVVILLEWLRIRTLSSQR